LPSYIELYYKPKIVVQPSGVTSILPNCSLFSRAAVQSL